MIWGSQGGIYTVDLTTVGLMPTEPAALTIKYGMWNGVVDAVDVSVNGSDVGTLQVSGGYIVPGPQYITFDITGDLVNGVNTFTFQGDLVQDYVVGQVTVDYNGTNTPAPGALISFGVAAAGALLRRRRAR